MPRRDFRTLLERQWDQNKFLCIGLDSDARRLPKCLNEGNHADRMFKFNEEIVDATRDIVCAYKLNIAFYEAEEEAGLDALAGTICHIKYKAPRVLIILDGKRGDIGNTNEGYVSASFDWFLADAVTLSPYLGGEALAPFLTQRHKGCFILCRTSNPGAKEFQDLVVGENGERLYERVARNVETTWNTSSNCGLVMGATAPNEIERVRRLHAPTLPYLIPGIGAQGGDLAATVKAARDSRGRGMIINSSRDIIFASKKADFAEAAYRKTLAAHEAILEALNSP